MRGARFNYPFLTQKERDNETGLDFFEARYYSSTQGRFTSVDPENAGAAEDEPQSWNGYAYVHNNPLAFIDPDGLERCAAKNANGDCVQWVGDNDGERSKEISDGIYKDGAYWNEKKGIWETKDQYQDRTGPAVIQVFLVSEPPSTRDKIANFFSAEESRFRGARADAAMQQLFDFRSCHCRVGIIFPVGLPSGLRMATPALSELFSGGSVRNMPIINIRSTLLEGGFTQTSSFRGSGYLFRNAAGEEVRIMNRGGGWEIRVKNASGNYLDEFGNVASPAKAHGIGVRVR